MITKEELESRGWSFNGYRFTKGDIWKENVGGASLKISDESSVIIITTDIGWAKDGPESSVKFNGKCQDITTFDFICGLININC